MSKKQERFTVKQFAEKHNVPRRTVTLWCQTGFLRGAFQEQTPFGDVWFIPQKVYENFNKNTDMPVRGRPKQQKELRAA